jgi:hypothetical protein
LRRNHSPPRMIDDDAENVSVSSESSMTRTGPLSET